MPASRKTSDARRLERLPDRHLPPPSMCATSLRAESSRMSAPAVVASPAGPSTTRDAARGSRRAARSTADGQRGQRRGEQRAHGGHGAEDGDRGNAPNPSEPAAAGRARGVAVGVEGASIITDSRAAPPDSDRPAICVERRHDRDVAEVVQQLPRDGGRRREFVVSGRPRGRSRRTRRRRSRRSRLAAAHVGNRCERTVCNSATSTACRHRPSSASTPSPLGLQQRGQQRLDEADGEEGGHGA